MERLTSLAFAEVSARSSSKRSREVQHLVHFDAVEECATPDEGDTVCDMIWVEEWRGDEVRSRLAVRQLRGEKRLDTFAAMPDSFFVRFQLLKCSANKDFCRLDH